MAPSSKVLEKEITSTVCELYNSDIVMTVNIVRKNVEKKLGLDDGFFKQPDWKDRSRDLVHKIIAELESGQRLPTSSSPPSKPSALKNGLKRQSDEESSPKPKAKRVKKEAPSKPKKAAAKKEESESELSDLTSSAEDTKPKRRNKKPAKKQETDSELSDLASSEEESKPKKSTTRRKAKQVVDSEDEDKESDFKDTVSPPKRKRNQKSLPVKGTRAGSESEDEKAAVKDDSDSDTKDENQKESSSRKNEESENEKKTKMSAKEDVKPVVDDDSSELSSVIDEPLPKRKRKSKEPKAPSKAKSSHTKTAKELTGDEAEIKKLEHQLVQCGVRKIWAFELKEYGDNSRAKIRHLKQMLSDVGMGGRFSLAKAREIKERRELMADLEEVQAMEKSWGDHGRSSRSRSKPAVKDDSDEESDVVKKPRVSKRQADLAFLGSESESDSE